MAKMVNQRPVKNCKQFSTEDKSMTTGWRQKNVIKSEISRYLGCGVDAIGWLSLYTFTVRYVHTVRRVAFLAFTVPTS
jgi:hypothetical protein